MDQIVNVRFFKIIAGPGERVHFDLTFSIADEEGYRQIASVNVVLGREDYQLSELRDLAVQQGRELLSRLASLPLSVDHPAEPGFPKQSWSKGGNMGRQVLWVRACLLVIAFLIIGISAGCIGPRYRHNDPSPTGTFYPNGCVTVRGREANAFIKSDIYTICQPVKISEVAIATYPWQPENPGEHEVALLEFSNASVYVWTSTLRDIGRIQYDGYETASSRTWRSVTGLFWGLINAGSCLVLFIIFAAFVLLVRIFGK